jgi:hypothetical protein
VKKNPENFLPWTYQATVRRIKQANLGEAPPPEGRELTVREWNERQERIRQQRKELRNTNRRHKKPTRAKSRSA